MRTLRVMGSIAWLIAASAGRAHAYLDPGSGSMLLQLLLGGVAGLAVLGKLYWRKLLGLVGLGRTKKDRP